MRTGNVSLMLFLVAMTTSGCAPRPYVAPASARYSDGSQAPVPKYDVIAKVAGRGADMDELELQTHAVGCLRPQASRQAIEHLEIYGPDNTFVTSLDKSPLAMGNGDYKGNFAIGLPITIPSGRYRIDISLIVDGQLCVTHKGILTRRDRRYDSEGRPGSQPTSSIPQR